MTIQMKPAAPDITTQERWDYTSRVRDMLSGRWTPHLEREMAQHIADERYRSGAVTEPKLQDGQVVRVRVREAPTLDIVEHAAEAPSHFRRTLDLRLPAAEAVALGEPSRGSMETEGLGDKLFGD